MHPGTPRFPGSLPESLGVTSCMAHTSSSMVPRHMRDQIIKKAGTFPTGNKPL